MLQLQAIAAFGQVYAQLDTALRRRYWRVLSLSGLVGILELLIAAAISLLGVALAAPQSLLDNPAAEYLLNALPALAPVAADQRQLLIFLLASLCLAIAVKALCLAFLTWRQACLAQAVGVFSACVFTVCCWPLPTSGMCGRI